MPNDNTIYLTGHAGRDAELRYTPQGTAVANFSLAVSRPKRRDSNEQPETDWFRVTAWEWLAERVSQTVKKGGTISVKGRLSQREYTDSNNQTRYSLEVNAQNVVAEPPSSQSGQPQQQAAPQPQQQSNESEDLPW